MKILIMVLSFNEPPFSGFMQAQKDTWDKVQHRDVDVLYYHGGNITEMSYWKLTVACSDDYDMMHWKFKLALDVINYHEYDFVFRTNSCSYIVKDKLLEVAKSLPKQQCYAGYQNGTYISGAGIFFSPDVLDILKAELTVDPHGAEDVLIGQILNGRVPMIADNSRIDATVEGFNGSLDSYHFRAKTSNDLTERHRDVTNMIKLHQTLTQ